MEIHHEIKLTKEYIIIKRVDAVIYLRKKKVNEYARNGDMRYSISASDSLIKYKLIVYGDDLKMLLAKSKFLGELRIQFARMPTTNEDRRNITLSFNFFYIYQKQFKGSNCKAISMLAVQSVY
jgi:hypothetical protein